MKVFYLFIPVFIFTMMLYIMVSCSDSKPIDPNSNYAYAYGKQIPDSLRDDMAKFITETMRASSYHLTTSDYEDVDDAIEEVTKTATEIYSIYVEGLNYNDPNDSYSEYWKFIPYSQLSDKQKAIFTKLKAGQK